MKNKDSVQIVPLLRFIEDLDNSYPETMEKYLSLPIAKKLDYL